MLIGVLPASTEPLWREVETKEAPPPRIHFTSTWDPVKRRFLMIGGGVSIPALTYFSDVWSFDVKTDQWREIVSVQTPPARAGHTTTWDPIKERLLVFGGRGTDRILHNDTWAFDVKTDQWHKVEGKNQPLPRTHHTTTWDPIKRRFLVVGGRSGNDTYLPETWALEDPPAAAPPTK